MPLVVPGIMQAPKKHEKKEGEDKNKDEKPLAQPQDFQAAPGPVIPEDTKVFEQKPTPEEQEERMKALNQ